ncbi:MAG: SDR family oxidoreductase [Pseudomonadales bacterium]|jgi:NAD(P)-dependent dehydrogenase (short-subunit alcohol dehydrogenase family)|nr:SDR family oxidoreductase [Pseudomonadales bacterium]MDP6470577.1 SDR family oxidoreductase [Pseudomonadales bacterium]MDP6828568.1 SDR family oxidoreductase [Pseudomonadales bacterium]MDP6971866.1 SDR family oxidoreductase [Pseudomonadales bacterium]|tara:strand:+ start:1078 stop:1794 length:717 start_codon:yes stop_codon:yes gene_type:complete
MDIAGNKALVFGGTSGIGLAAANRLQDGGATVVVFGRSDSNIATALTTLGNGARAISADVLDRDALTEIFEAEAPFDILVNTATGGDRAMGPFLEMDLDGFQGSFRKLWGYTNTVHLGTRHLSEDGCIVLVSGAPARKARPGNTSLSTVGNAVEGFVRAVAPEIAPRRINVVSPGIIDTPMFPVRGEVRDEFLGKATAGNLIKRAGTADEVAHGILFAIENDFVTGTTVDVDGGMLLP